MSSDIVDHLRSAFAVLTPGRPESAEGLRPFYDDGIVFQDPVQIVRGLEPFVAMNRRLLARSRALTFDMKGGRGDADEAFVAWTMKMTPKVGPTFLIDGVTHARARDGKIVSHRDYWDLGEMFASVVPGGPAALRFFRKPLA